MRENIETWGKLSKIGNMAGARRLLPNLQASVLTRGVWSGTQVLPRTGARATPDSGNSPRSQVRTRYSHQDLGLEYT